MESCSDCGAEKQLARILLVDKKSKLELYFAMRAYFRFPCPRMNERVLGGEGIYGPIWRR
jgi:hypothetical protein